MHTVIASLRQWSLTYMPLHWVIEGTPQEAQFDELLIIDRTEAVMSQDEFFKYLSENTM